MQELGVVRDFAALKEQRRSGVLEVRAPGTTSFFYLLEGAPVFVEEGSAGDTLGRALIRAGHLTHEQYLETLRQSTSMAESEQMLFAMTAVELGFVSDAQVEAALEALLTDRLVAILQHAETTRTFDQSSEALEGVRHSRVPAEALFMEGVRRYYDDARLLPILAPHFGTVARLRQPAEELTALLQLGQAESMVLASIDGFQPLGLVLDTRVPELGGTGVARVLVALLLMDLVADASETPVRAPPPPALPREHDAARGEQAAEAALEAKRELARRHATKLREMAERARPASIAPPPTVPEAKLRRVRPSQITRQRKVVAEQAFRHAQRALEQGKWSAAADWLKKALEADDTDAAEHRLCLAWAEFRAAAGPETEEALEWRVKETLARNREHAFANYVRGHLQLRSGEEKKAYRSFKTAIDSDPTLFDAERQLRLLRSRLKP